MTDTPVAQALRDAAATLAPLSDTARLDAEVLMAHALGVARSDLLLRHMRDPAPAGFTDLLARRMAHEPVAYITGTQEFYGRSFAVSSDVLIPRGDSETLVEAALAAHAAPARVLDLGTGTGAIALALATERPAWQVCGVDRIEAAVRLAERNRLRLGLHNAAFTLSDWFAGLNGERFQMIVSNPPYIPASDPHLQQGDVRFEPQSALIAGADGLDDIRTIIAQAAAHLQSGGWLLLEHGYDQAEAVRMLLLSRGFEDVQSRLDLGGHERISLGRFS